MKNTVFELRNDFWLKLRTPSNVMVKSFTNNKGFIYGNPVEDNATLALNPWVTAMKYIRHMETRGWNSFSIFNNIKHGSYLIVVAMERI